MSVPTDFTQQIAQLATLQNCRLAEMLITANGLDQRGFENWLFCPGMQFNSMKKWWGNHGQRDFPHEGIDLCLFGGIDRQIYRMDETSRVPVLGNGVVRALFRDYLGQAIIIEHEKLHPDDRRLLSIYAHTKPLPKIQVGVGVRDGDIIATLADTSTSKANIIPHLHFSLGLSSPSLNYDAFVWNVIRKPDRFTLLDPLQYIQLPYRMNNSDSPYCHSL